MESDCFLAFGQRIHTAKLHLKLCVIFKKDSIFRGNIKKFKMQLKMTDVLHKAKVYASIDRIVYF